MAWSSTQPDIPMVIMSTSELVLKGSFYLMMQDNIKESKNFIFQNSNEDFVFLLEINIKCI